MLKVAIIGRPNVGKSTLFNRILGRNKAITSPIAGTTRDSVTSIIEWNNKVFELTDMGGLDNSLEDELNQAVMTLIKTQLEGIDHILFMVDAHVGLVQADIENLQLIRKYEKPVWIVVNKCDNDELVQSGAEFYRLGVDNVFFLSSTQGKNVADLLDELASVVPDMELPEKPVKEPIRIAILGRPNVGKSSIVNAILGQNKVIVSEIAGTTRDAVDTELIDGDDHFVLIDTAGIRRPGKIKPGSLEKFSVMRGEFALDRCHIAVLVIDVIEGITHQDQHIVSKILEQKRGLIIVANKWDLVDTKQTSKEAFMHYAIKTFDYLHWATFIFTSAVTKLGIKELLTQAKRIREMQQVRINEDDLGYWFTKVIHKHPMFGFFHNKPIKIFDVAQVGIDPPHFQFHVNEPKGVHFSTKRYLENQLREDFDFAGVAIQCSYKKRR